METPGPSVRREFKTRSSARNDFFNHRNSCHIISYLRASARCNQGTPIPGWSRLVLPEEYYFLQEWYPPLCWTSVTAKQISGDHPGVGTHAWGMDDETSTNVITRPTSYWSLISDDRLPVPSYYIPRQGLGIFLFTTASRPARGSTQPPIQWVPGALSLGLKRPWREADHSPPSNTEIKNPWSYTSIPPVRLHGVLLS
jgi:hypothetical protein